MNEIVISNCIESEDQPKAKTEENKRREVTRVKRAGELKSVAAA